MKLPGVDWDENKNAINKAKHSGLSFEVASMFFLIPIGWSAGMKAKVTRPERNGAKPWVK
jgi:uncharacterized DUF497 family protein